MERFDIFAEKGGIGESPQPESNSVSTNGHEKGKDSVTPVEPSSPAQSSRSQKRQAESEERADLSGKTPPAKKKKSDPDVDADAVFAAKLQAEENLRARPTRGGNTRRTQPVKKKTKAKTAKKVRAEDDSDLDSGSDAGKKVNRSTGFHVCFLNAPRNWILDSNGVFFFFFFLETPEPLTGPFCPVRG